MARSDKKKVNKTKKPVLVKIEEIFITKADLPESGREPDDENARFKELKVHLKKYGQLTPVFINPDKRLLQGHYRLWGLKANGETYVKAFVIDDSNNEIMDKEINAYFDEVCKILPFSCSKSEKPKPA